MRQGHAEPDRRLARLVFGRSWLRNSAGRGCSVRGRAGFAAAISVRPSMASARLPARPSRNGANQVDGLVSMVVPSRLKVITFGAPADILHGTGPPRP